MSKLLTCVLDEGVVNPLTGEVYPDGVPKERTVSQIFNLLSQGYTVEDRTDGARIPLEKQSFFLVNANEILGLRNHKVKEKPPVNTTVSVVETTEVKDNTQPNKNNNKNK